MVGLGLAAGTAAGVLAVAPAVAAGQLPVAWLAAAAAAVFAAAAAACLLAAGWHAIPERPQAD
jgi:hypothetical protein